MKWLLVVLAFGAAIGFFAHEAKAAIDPRSAVVGLACLVALAMSAGRRV